MEIYATQYGVLIDAMLLAGVEAEEIGRHRDHQPAGDDDCLGKEHRTSDL